MQCFEGDHKYLKKVVPRTRRSGDESIAGSDVLLFSLLRRQVARVIVFCNMVKIIRGELMNIMCEASITDTITSSKYPVGVKQPMRKAGSSTFKILRGGRISGKIHHSRKLCLFKILIDKFCTLVFMCHV